MGTIFTEENGFYSIDCSNAIWATDSVHDLYMSQTVSILSDVDWIIETDEFMLLVEYKNADIPGATAPDKFKPELDQKINSVVRKYYDTLHYLNIFNKTKPKKYIYILEYPKGDVVSRKMIRNKLKKKLPFNLQELDGSVNELINSVEVLEIKEWNKKYNMFPIYPTEKYVREAT